MLKLDNVKTNTGAKSHGLVEKHRVWSGENLRQFVCSVSHQVYWVSVGETWRGTFVELA